MSAPPPVNFGEELRDAFKPVNLWVAQGISWLDDIQSFYRERAAIEKEYAAKLNSLSKRYYDRKSKKSAALTVGDIPQLTPGSLESASLTTWGTILTTTEALATEHETLSTALSSQVCDVLKAIGTRYDDFLKRYQSLASKLQAQRDEVYGDLKKSKAEYDAECKTVEEKRQKVDKSYDAGKGKAERAYKAEMQEMSNVKNSYLLQINVSNHYKRRYFYEGLPDILNSLQDLNEIRVAKLNHLWTLSSNLETTCYNNSIAHLSTQVSEISRNLPTLDSGMFAKHNTCYWAEPADFVFEPSPIWHDNPDIVVDDAAQVFLRNMLQKSKRGMHGLNGEVERRQKEIQAISAQRDKVKLDEGQAQRDTELARAVIFTSEELIPHAAKLLAFSVEADTIIGAIGDLTRGTQSHNFKSTSFKIPASCDYCFEKIWGVSAKGFTCTDCGFTCHAKCEMKVPATCPGVLDKAAKKALKEENRKSKAIVANGGSDGELSRSNTMTSLSSSYAASGRQPSVLGRRVSKSPSVSSVSSGPSHPPPSSAATARNRVVAPPPDRYAAPPLVEDSPPSSPGGSPLTEKGKMLYAFDGHGDDELKVTAGMNIIILEDDGAWITARRPDGQEGIVPTSYVERIPDGPPAPPPRSPSPPTPAPAPAAAPRATRTLIAPPAVKVGKRGPPPPVKPRGQKNLKKVRALYPYEPQGEDEIEMDAGEEFVVVERDVGGWVRVKTRGGEGLVPGTYVEDV